MRARLKKSGSRPSAQGGLGGAALPICKLVVVVVLEIVVQ